MSFTELPNSSASPKFNTDPDDDDDDDDDDYDHDDNRYGAAGDDDNDTIPGVSIRHGVGQKDDYCG